MKILLGFLLCVVATVSNAEGHAWKLNDFSFSLPQSFSRIHKSDAFQLINTQGVGVTVDAIPQNDQMSSDQLIEKWSAYAENQISQVAERHGTIKVPLRREVLPSGNILYTLEESVNSKGRQHGFGLFFVLISPKGRIAQLVFEGPGDAGMSLETYRPYVVSAKWL